MTRTRKWSMLSAVVAVAVLLAGWFLVVSPKRASADDLRVQAAAQNTKNDVLKNQIAELQALQKDLPKQQAIIADVQQRIPQNPDLPALIRSLSSMAGSAGVTIHSFSPVAPVATSAQAPANAVGLNGQTLQVI
ncbi:MAG: type 4a pilus biogenesis protein PilO, partial [Actinomycetes bacterium]